MASIPDPPTPESAHDVTVAAITRYYHFLERLCIPGITEYPPEGGWPQMKPHLAEHLNLSPEALRLVKDLPYFKYQIVPDCHTHNYLAGFEHVQATLDATDNPPPPIYEGRSELDPQFPPHIFPLAEGGYRWGTKFAIDAKRGVAIWHDKEDPSLPRGWPEPDAVSEIHYTLGPDAYEDVGSVRGWRAAPTYRVETFFAMAEEQLKQLNWIPSDLTGGIIQEPRGELDEEQEATIKIMRDAGWPGDDWDRDRAIKELDDWIEARDELEEVEESMEKLEANL